jgi:hypothetical protein
MKADILLGSIKEIDHLSLCQPYGFILNPYFYLKVGVLGIPVNNYFGFFQGDS